MQLAEVLGALQGLAPAERAALEASALERTPLWVPNPGPQTDAYFSEADELFYGGQAGGGKTDLVAGLALTEHRRSLILRRYGKDAISIAERVQEILGDAPYEFRQNPTTSLQVDDRKIDFGGCPEESDKQRYKGTPHDLIAFDEVSDFLKSQYRFIIAWNRSADPAQRCRVLCTGNPPTTAEGLWVIEHWGAWLDPNHPNPAKEGELRWYTTGADGKDVEVDGPGPHFVEGEAQPVYARSRTFIRARLADNPDLAQTNYDSVLAALPVELRQAYREGRFDLGLKDDPWQVIPTSWIRAAQARWTDKPPANTPQCAIGCDVAQGGDDETVLAPRYDGWYPPLIAVPGRQTPFGKDVAGLVVSHRRHDSTVVIDMGGGYGGATYEHLKENGVEVVAYKGAEKTEARTKDGKLGFVNVRSLTYWRFREALDPSQPEGSPIALPPDPTLVADLTAPKFEVGPRGIAITEKRKLVETLGRSPDRGDAVVMAWASGAKAVTHGVLWRQDQRFMPRSANRMPTVNYGPRRKPRG